MDERDGLVGTERWMVSRWMDDGRMDGWMDGWMNDES